MVKLVDAKRPFKNSVSSKQSERKEENSLLQFVKIDQPELNCQSYVEEYGHDAERDSSDDEEKPEQNRQYKNPLERRVAIIEAALIKRAYTIEYLNERIENFERHQREMFQLALYELALTFRSVLTTKGSTYAPSNRGFCESVRERSVKHENVDPQTFALLYKHIQQIQLCHPGIITDFPKTSAGVPGNYKVVFETLQALSNTFGTSVVVKAYNAQDGLDEEEEDDEEEDDEEGSETEQQQGGDDEPPQPYFLVCAFPLFRNKIEFIPYLSKEIGMMLSDSSTYRVGTYVHCLRTADSSGKNKQYDYGLLTDVGRNLEGKTQLRVQFQTPSKSPCDSGVGEAKIASVNAKKQETFDKQQTVTAFRDKNRGKIMYPSYPDAKEVCTTEGLWKETAAAAKSINSPYGPLTLKKKHVNIYPLRMECINNKWYYLAIASNRSAAKHVLVTVPPGFNAPGQIEDFPLRVRGDVGFIPARYMGLLEAVMLPSVHYNTRQSRGNSVRYNVRLAVTNPDMHILGGEQIIELSTLEKKNMKRKYGTEYEDRDGKYDN